MRVLLAFLMMIFVAPIGVARADAMDPDMARAVQIRALQGEISDLERQLEECKRKNKNWRTATWVGVGGTVATGVGAVVQGVKLNKIKNKKPEDKKDDDKK